MTLARHPPTLLPHSFIQILSEFRRLLNLFFITPVPCATAITGIVHLFIQAIRMSFSFAIIPCCRHIPGLTTCLLQRILFCSFKAPLMTISVSESVNFVILSAAAFSVIRLFSQ